MYFAPLPQLKTRGRQSNVLVSVRIRFLGWRAAFGTDGSINRAALAAVFTS
jgi:hypothetical protein